MQMQRVFNKTVDLLERESCLFLIERERTEVIFALADYAWGSGVQCQLRLTDSHIEVRISDYRGKTPWVILEDAEDLRYGLAVRVGTTAYEVVKFVLAYDRECKDSRIDVEREKSLRETVASQLVLWAYTMLRVIKSRHCYGASDEVVYVGHGCS